MSQMQCLGPGSIGSAKFGLPGSGSANISTKKCKKDIIKFSFLNGLSSFRIKISEKNRTKNF